MDTVNTLNIAKEQLENGQLREAFKSYGYALEGEGMKSKLAALLGQQAALDKGHNPYKRLDTFGIAIALVGIVYLIVGVIRVISLIGSGPLTWQLTLDVAGLPLVLNLALASLLLCAAAKGLKLLEETRIANRINALMALRAQAPAAPQAPASVFPR